jgi:predicted oxidoreductase
MSFLNYQQKQSRMINNFVCIQIDRIMEEQEKMFGFDPLVVGTMRLGSWGANFDTRAYRGFIEACLELGLRDFDHADIYGDYTTEAEFGQVIKEEPSLREKVRLITKCGIKMKSPNRPDHLSKSYDLGRNHIVSSVDQSLKNFHTEYLDVLLLHRPDVLMDPFEISETFEQLYASGKVKYFGVSNFTTWQFDALNKLYPLVTNQLEISVAHTDPFLDGTIQQCMNAAVQPMAWSPLAGGTLFGENLDKRSIRILAIVESLAEKHDVTTDAIMLAFLMYHPAGIVPVLGTSRIDRIKTAITAASVELTKEEWYQIWEARLGHEVA